MAYVAKDYSALLGAGVFSEALLKNHMTLYQGYVNNTNKLDALLKAKAKDGMNPEYAELKRRFGFEWNGMRLHEYYFENLGPTASPDKSGRLAKMMADSFGSYEAWEEDFKATGSLRGVGWAILYQDETTGSLYNEWINEHHHNHLAGGRIIMVMDVWEHAFMLDYGLARATYIGDFFQHINWSVVEARLKAIPPPRA
jgi:Fe-Mn family superoxide dismutase